MERQRQQSLIQALWDRYRQTSVDIAKIEAALKNRGITALPLDHFAVIDLPGKETGMAVLERLFHAFGFSKRGAGYLPEKQNDFTWMAEVAANTQLAEEALPQAVVADFRPNEMPDDIRNIIMKYAGLAKKSPVNELVANINTLSPTALETAALAYLSGRDWPLPTVAEFEKVHAFNELLAWVLVFGRRPNHFTISVHLLPGFADLASFHQFIEEEVGLTLNTEGGKIKGNHTSGIAQGSTISQYERVALADGSVMLPTNFVEFVWRYPLKASHTKPTAWDDYFTGFVAQHANHVIESLFTSP